MCWAAEFGMSEKVHYNSDFIKIKSNLALRCTIMVRLGQVMHDAEPWWLQQTAGVNWICVE